MLSMKADFAHKSHICLYKDDIAWNLSKNGISVCTHKIRIDHSLVYVHDIMKFSLETLEIGQSDEKEGYIEMLNMFFLKRLMY